MNNEFLNAIENVTPTVVRGTDLYSAFASLQSKMNLVIAQVNTINDNVNDIPELKSTVSQLLNTTQEIMSEITAINQDITQTKNDITSLTPRVNTLESEMTDQIAYTSEIAVEVSKKANQTDVDAALAGKQDKLVNQYGVYDLNMYNSNPKSGMRIYGFGDSPLSIKTLFLELNDISGLNDDNQIVINLNGVKPTQDINDIYAVVAATWRNTSSNSVSRIVGSITLQWEISGDTQSDIIISVPPRSGYTFERLTFHGIMPGILFT